MTSEERELLRTIASAGRGPKPGQGRDDGQGALIALLGPAWQRREATRRGTRVQVDGVWWPAAGYPDEEPEPVTISPHSSSAALICGSNDA